MDIFALFEQIMAALMELIQIVETLEMVLDLLRQIGLPF